VEQSLYVESVTRSNAPITNIWSNNFLGWPGKPEELRVIFSTVATEYDYTRTMGIDILMGRDFSEEFKNDTNSIIISKAALELMELEDPIGTELDLWGEKKKLIGVVDDVLMGSPDSEIKPLFMILDPDWVGVITVRLSKTKDLEESLAAVEQVFNKHNPAYPFEFEFADIEFQKKFNTIEMTSRLSTLFAILAMIITGLGLFGLASYTAEQRTKEIGIRKVLGASVSSLVQMISRDFSIQVVIAFVLAAPVGAWLMNMYLEQYQIRVPLEWWIFPATGLITLAFALMIVSSQAFRAAHSDPVKSLRSE
jgi:ABC-type antimicrobial peptide transport system permease subunit